MHILNNTNLIKMRKLIIFFLAAIISMLMATSCGQNNEAKDIKMENRSDSVSYSLGVIYGDGIRQYYMQNVENEEAAIKAFLNAFKKAYNDKAEVDELYGLGLEIGSTFKQQEKEGIMGFSDMPLNYEHIRRGFVDGLNGAQDGMNIDQAQEFIQKVMMEIQQQAGQEQNAFSISRIDSLNYALGVVNGSSIKMFYMENEATEEGVRSFMKGVDKAMNNNSEYHELETIGESSGYMMKRQNETGLMGIEGMTVNFDAARQGYINGIMSYEDLMTIQDANAFIQTVAYEAENERIEKLFSENRKTGEDFLAENAAKEGVVTLPSGLQYKIVTEGKGAIPTIHDRVTVHYHGTLIDGTVFDSSVDRGEPFTLSVKGVITGWTEALQLMPVGSKWILFVPYSLAYGNSDMGVIKPFSALMYEMELLGIEK